MRQRRGNAPWELLERLKSLGRRLLSDRTDEVRPDRRSSRRIKLPIPVRVKVGPHEFRERRLRDVNLLGLCVEEAPIEPPGEKAAVQFEGYPGICEEFLLFGHVARITEDEPPGVAIEIDREVTTDKALHQYRKLVLHYLRHRPLLDDLRRGFVAGRCHSCGWLGRVSDSSSRCPRCGQPVAPAWPI